MPQNSIGLLHDSLHAFPSFYKEKKDSIKTVMGLSKKMFSTFNFAKFLPRKRLNDHCNGGIHFVALF